jgi:hypothetical protein
MLSATVHGVHAPLYQGPLCHVTWVMRGVQIALFQGRLCRGDWVIPVGRAGAAIP